MRRSPHPFDEAKARAAAWLSAWDSQGVHRTGTTGDEAGARWLTHEAVALGAEVASEVFTLDRLDPVACYLELDGERIPGVPMFDAPATGAEGVTGTLTLSGHEDGILIAKVEGQEIFLESGETMKAVSTIHQLLHRTGVFISTEQAGL